MQQLDLLIAGALQRRDSLDKEIAGEEARVREARAALESLEQTGTDRRKEYDRLDLELKGKEEKINKLTVQMNTAQTNREFQAFLHEIGTLRADNSRLEDNLLRLLEGFDAAKQRLAEAKERLRRAEGSRDAKRGEIAQLQTGVDAEVADLRARRETLAAGLKPQFREVYERLHQGLGGRAVAAARDQSCQGCYMHLTHNTIAHLMAESELIRCGSCGRILYLDHEEEVEEEE